MAGYDHASAQTVNVLLMVQLWIVMTLAIAFVNLDSQAANVISVKRDSQAANVMNVNRRSLAKSVMNANQTTSIIHCVKVCINT